MSNQAFQERFKGKTSLMPKEGVDGVIRNSDNPINKGKQSLSHLQMEGFTAHQRYFNQKREAHTFDQARPFFSPEKVQNGNIYSITFSKSNKTLDHQSDQLPMSPTQLQNALKHNAPPRAQNLKGNPMTRKDMDSIDKQMEEIMLAQMALQQKQIQLQSQAGGKLNNQFSTPQMLSNQKTITSTASSQKSDKIQLRQQAFSANKQPSGKHQQISNNQISSQLGSKQTTPNSHFADSKNFQEMLNFFNTNNNVPSKNAQNQKGIQGSIFSNPSQQQLAQQAIINSQYASLNGLTPQQWQYNKQNILQLNGDNAYRQNPSKGIIPGSNSSIPEAEFEETRAFPSDTGKNEINYKPYTLNEYKEMQKNQNFKLGGLGPNIGNEEWKEKKEYLDKRQEFAKQVQQINTQILRQQQEEGKVAVIKTKQEISTREKALEFAKGIQKPTSGTSSSDACQKDSSDLTKDSAIRSSHSTNSLANNYSQKSIFDKKGSSPSIQKQLAQQDQYARYGGQLSSLKEVDEVEASHLEFLNQIDNLNK